MESNNKSQAVKFELIINEQKQNTNISAGKIRYGKFSE